MMLGILLTSAEVIQKSYVCPTTELKQEIKPLLKPDFKYDSSKITRLSISGEAKSKEIEVPLFIGEKYRFIFNTSEMPEGVNIVVYDKKQGKKNRVKLFSIQDELNLNKDQTTFVFEPLKSRTMYVDYELPTTDHLLKGCVVFLLGYRI